MYDIELSRGRGQHMAQMAVNAEQVTQSSLPTTQSKELNRRGFNVYTLTQLMAVTGKDKQGEIITGSYESPLFWLTIDERIDIARKCAPVFGIITSRMNRIAGLEWHVKCDNRENEKTAQKLKDYYKIFHELYGSPNIREMVAAVRLRTEIMRRLPEVKQDLSNFSTALLRWNRNIKRNNEDRSQDIEAWLKEVNQEDSFESFVKKIVMDLMTHGNFSAYKEEMGNVIENLYILPGGTIYPLKDKYVGSYTAFTQLSMDLDPKIYYENEISFHKYVPTSAVQYGFIPLEALVNKVSEYLLFDKLAADRADGSRPPEKLVVMGENSPFGGLQGDFDGTLPLDPEEQKRIETVMNEARKESVRILSGHGTPAIVDISKADTFQFQSERQTKIKEDVALVYNMSNLEINETGGAGTSGRATSESQERLEVNKGIFPIVNIIENFLNKEVLPFRYGTGYSFEFKTKLSELEEIEKIAKKLQSGFHSVNEIREEEGLDPFEGDEFNKPQSAQPPAMGSPENPMITESRD